MAIDSSVFIHPSDDKALKALKMIPGFTPALKAFMKFWDERQAKILNLSSNLKVSDKQLDKYYKMLVPICEKLGINVPELYITLDPIANAWTYGDNNPYITMTSGLIETVPEKLIPTILAHECGHIVCHHCLYTTMGDLIFSGAEGLLAQFASFALGALRIPFFYWMRCSEFSADRAAIACDGTADNTIELMMRFAGCDKDIIGNVNKDEFLQQAIEYKEFLKDDKLNKAMEMLLIMNEDHPFASVRAYEANEWIKSTEFISVIKNI